MTRMRFKAPGPMARWHQHLLLMSARPLALAAPTPRLPIFVGLKGTMLIVIHKYTAIHVARGRVQAAC